MIVSNIEAMLSLSLLNAMTSNDGFKTDAVSGAV